jgi:2-desacetyl-2-hydroxyethyl bacteriochlorophyllide A dehydrogenase
MRAIRFAGIGVAEYVWLPDPRPEPQQVVVQVEAAGLCGTDIHALNGEFPVQFPLVPGHEFVGWVVQAGEEVDPELVGRRVAVHPLLPCGRCEPCCAGRINFCQSLRVYGGNLPGGLAEQVAVSVSSLRWLPEGIDFETACFAEPLSCVLHGLRLIGVERGDRILVFGAGPIGLLMLQACRALGAAEVVSVEPVAAKRDRAVALGAISAAPGDDLPRRAFDLVIDASGVPSVVERGIGFVRDGGRFLLFGVCPPGTRIALDPFDVFRREITICGCFSLTDEMESAIALLANGAIVGQPLITGRLGLEDVPAFLAAQGVGGRSIKAIVLPQR